MKKQIDETLNKYIAAFQDRVSNKISFKAKLHENMYDEAVRLAYNDAKRALKGVTNSESRKIEKANGLKSLSEVLKQYFEQNSDFKHEVFCKRFIDSFKDYKMTYGAAQKIVNLAFKYLYCFENFRKKYYKKFEPCQMVLDSFILSWFKRNFDKTKQVRISYNETWSGMDDYKRYSKIQELIADYVKQKGKGLSVLEYEFILWPNTMLYEAAVSWMSTITDQEKSIIYQKFPFNELNELIHKISNSCSSHDVDQIVLSIF